MVNQKESHNMPNLEADKLHQQKTDRLKIDSLYALNSWQMIGYLLGWYVFWCGG